MNDAPDLITRDKLLLWHPYSSFADSAPPWLVESADGVNLDLVNQAGTRHRVVDAMSSWWCMIHGYRHPTLDNAAKDQINVFSHVMFGGLTHAPAIELAERLVQITQERLKHVFFADSGSVSVEVALKLSYQYQVARGRPERRRLLTIRGGYHGDTMAAMSVCDPVDGMHTMFAGTVTEQFFAPRPPAGFHRRPDDPDIRRWAARTAQLAAEHRDEIAAIIVEPVLQGAGGMHIYSPACLSILRQLADEHGFLLIYDEIATGFGRTGTLFAGEHAPVDGNPVEPDILCLGKALTGGYLTMAAMLCSAEVASTLSASSVGALQHGPTFMANPLACAVSIASIDLLLSGDWQARIRSINNGLSAGLEAARELPSVREVRTLGAVGVVQLDRQVDVAAVTRAAIERGVWVRPFRDLVYTMPPYTSTDRDIETITGGIVGAIAAVHPTAGRASSVCHAKAHL